jgi:hypothetical protein
MQSTPGVGLWFNQRQRVDQLTMSATYGWGSPDRKLGHVPRVYLRLHRSIETGTGAIMPHGSRFRSHPCDPSLPYGHSIGKEN